MTATMMICLGLGVFNWPRGERVSDRYGAVTLYEDPDNDNVVLRAEACELADGEFGVLMARVIETRQSYHIGDIMRGFYPSTPQISQEIYLGTGRFFIQLQGEIQTVGLKPADGRAHDWLNPERLYQAHHQTVELYFIPGEA